jgi:hypothetical protein
MNLRISRHRVKPPGERNCAHRAAAAHPLSSFPGFILQFVAIRPGGSGKMRRLFSLAAFGFGFYYLWNNNDFTIECVAVGAMGLALLLEFLGAD